MYIQNESVLVDLPHDELSILHSGHSTSPPTAVDTTSRDTSPSPSPLASVVSTSPSKPLTEPSPVPKEPLSKPVATPFISIGDLETAGLEEEHPKPKASLSCHVCVCVFVCRQL